MSRFKRATSGDAPAQASFGGRAFANNSQVDFPFTAVTVIARVFVVLHGRETGFIAFLGDHGQIVLGGFVILVRQAECAGLNHLFIGKVANEFPPAKAKMKGGLFDVFGRSARLALEVAFRIIREKNFVFLLVEEKANSFFLQKPGDESVVRFLILNAIVADERTALEIPGILNPEVTQNFFDDVLSGNLLINTRAELAREQPELGANFNLVGVGGVRGTGDISVKGSALTETRDDAAEISIVFEFLATFQSYPGFRMKHVSKR